MVGSKNDRNIERIKKAKNNFRVTLTSVNCFCNNIVIIIFTSGRPFLMLILVYLTTTVIRN